MMLFIKAGARTVEYKLDSDPSFLLTNKKGGFLLLGASRNTSKYNGMFFAKAKDDDFQIFKVLSDIRLDSPAPEEIVYNLTGIERGNKDTRESFMLGNSNTLFYQLSGYLGKISIPLDCRKIYDYSDQGRRYTVLKEDGLIIVRFEKFTDGSFSSLDYEIFCGIAGADDFRVKDGWTRIEYPFDQKRGSAPFESYVYDGIEIPVHGSRRLIITCGSSLDEIRGLVKHATENIEFLKKTKESYLKSMTDHAKKISEIEIDAAYRCSIAALDHLVCEVGGQLGIYAGLPWFFQFWTRDEAISLKALIMEERYEDAKAILFRHIDNILKDGRISNRYPYSMLGSADGVGWTFKRLHDLISALQKKQRLQEFISDDELQRIFLKAQDSFDKICSSYSFEHLIMNKPLETWMDTSFADDNRDGARIEIQALMLAQIKLLQALCLLLKKKQEFVSYVALEKDMKKEVRAHFWKKPVLFDGNNDPTVRPNIFMACYVYPDLLTENEWSVCLDHALKKLWLEWGGLSTIDKAHPYYTEQYTGENNKSYHRGDSWLFLNCMAAIAMYRIDKRKFRRYIKKIIMACARECLCMGIIGSSAELSSANRLSAEASPSQAWSSAMFIELVNSVDLDFIFKG